MKNINALIHIFKFDEYSWYRNCLDEVQKEIGKVGVVGIEECGADGKWTITIDAMQLWVSSSNSVEKAVPIIESYEGVKQ